jgi:hypothetical protein
VDEDKTYAELGIPGPAPCPPWCQGEHGGSWATPYYAMIMHGSGTVGHAMLVGDDVVGFCVFWAERFSDGAWQPHRKEDVKVLFLAGMEYTLVDATDRNMAGLAAIARLIAPDAEDRVRQVARLLKAPPAPGRASRTSAGDPARRPDAST